jgi:YYY domain-containing protein
MIERIQSRITSSMLVALILAVAAAFRFFGLDWDQGRSFHPDERRIAFALNELSFRPVQLNPHFFAYGSFPLYLQKIWVTAVGWLMPSWKSFSGDIFAARMLSAAVGTLMVASVAALGRRLYGRRAGILAAAFLALAVLPIQHAHFITFDLYQAALVLAVLERLLCFVDERRRGPYFAASALAGLALATKVSSAPLLLPLVVAPFLAPPADRRTRGRFAGAMSGLLIAAAAFVCGEPYALLDRAAFLHDVREQSEMVRQAGSMPYTLQYLHTVAYVDDLRQAFTWGMGPLLGLASAAGTIAALVRLGRLRHPGEVLVASFFLPYLLVTGWFPVKFMRYLLPLYPIWCLWAARIFAGEDSDPRRLRAIAAALVLAGTAAYASAFAEIYIRPHVWITAARWFYREVPAGSTILTPHWEEGFPVSVDGFAATRYHALELPLYEPDTASKELLLATRLAQGDVLVFPSKRLYGSISNAPQRYPTTSRFLELLFAGDLGYRLDRVFASRPSLFGFEIDDDSSDESFSVYDHPKTLVFRREAVLSAADIQMRIHSRVPSKPIRRVDLLNAGSKKPPTLEEAEAPWLESSVLACALWVFAAAALSWSGARIVQAAIPGVAAAAASGLGPIVGYLLFLYLSWLASALGWAPFGRMETLAVGAALIGVASVLPSVPSRAGGGIFFLTFLFFLAIRAFNPEIYWGEKPMDFSFLNSIYRARFMPPPEPWMSGQIINYPYLGHFGIAAIGKLTGVAPGLAFNLGLALVAGLTASTAFGVGTSLTGKRIGGLVSALLVAFAGNLSGLFELESRARRIDFDYFWATSRVIRDTINEFPLWSFLFADLHAHVMALPLGLLFIGIAAAWFAEVGASALVLALLGALTLGAIACTSTWSLPVYGAALCGIAVLRAIRERTITTLAFPPIVLALSYAFFWPYWTRFIPPPRNWGWEHATAPLIDVLLIFGGFLFVTLRALGDGARSAGVSIVLRVVVGVAIGLAAWLGTRYGFFAIAAAALVVAFLEADTRASFALVLAGGAALLGGLSDTIYLWDRMNTVFKLYLEMWLLLALAAAHWLSSDPRAPRSMLGKWGTRLALLALAALSAFTSVTDVIATLRTKRVPGPRPTLDGTAYLDAHRPFEAMAIRWLNRHIAGSPVLLEAQGPSYQEFSRISMHTGLPTILGWDYHLQQRAHPVADIERRKVDVRKLYLSEQRSEVERLLASYHVAIVYVGRLERQTYGVGLGKFDSWSDAFQPVYRNPEVAIYAVPSNFHWAETTPAIEQASAAAPAPEEVPPPLPSGELRQPRGIAVDRSGNVWVADFGNNRIQAFDASLQPLSEFGQRGEDAGDFRDPCGIAIGADGLLYVADTWNHRVEVFRPDGQLVRQWPGEFYGPRGIAVAPDGKVFVADTGNGRISVFTPDGQQITRFGRKGNGAGELLEPIGIAVSPTGRLYVADAGNRRISVFDLEGTPVATWPVAGWTPQVFREPYLAILDDGTVVATDPTQNRLIYYDPEGKIIRQLALPPKTTPTGIAALPGGALVVAGLETNRIFKVPAL